MRRVNKTSRGFAIGFGLVLCTMAHGQGVGFPSGASPTPTTPGWGTPATAAPVPGMTPSATAAPPAATLAPGIQPFDPYALPSGTPTLPPPLGYPGGAPTAYGAPPSTTPPPGSVPPWPAPGAMSAPPYSPYPTANPYGAGATTWGAQQGQPFFPNGLWTTQSGPPYQRLFQDTGGVYTWLYGSGQGNSLQINEFDLSTTAVFPNFLGGTGPLRVTPGFTFDFLSGPSPPVTVDLPPRLYSGYVDFTWKPQFTPQLGAQLGLRPGIFSDFSTVTSRSFRVIATGVGVIGLTPTNSLKLGVIYIDRNDLKLLPVAGIVWEPSAQKHWEIVFPSPKLACYWTTTGNTQVWWYLGAEYGGGAWTYDRFDGISDRVDINDIRVYVGLDWRNLNRWNGILEVGYVFNRQIVTVAAPARTVDLEDTIMLRAGLRW